MTVSTLVLPLFVRTSVLNCFVFSATRILYLLCPFLSEATVVIKDDDGSSVCSSGGGTACSSSSVTSASLSNMAFSVSVVRCFCFLADLAFLAALCFVELGAERLGGIVARVFRLAMKKMVYTANWNENRI